VREVREEIDRGGGLDALGFVDLLAQRLEDQLEEPVSMLWNW
jgi:hypothetical protein